MVCIPVQSNWGLGAYLELMKTALIAAIVKANYLKWSLLLSSANVHLSVILISVTALTGHQVDPLKISFELPNIPWPYIFGVCLGFYLLAFLLMLIMT